MTLAALDAVRDAAEIDRAQLADIRTVKLGLSLPVALRAEQYLEQIRSPYCFLYDGSVVRVRFAPGGGDLRDRLKNYFISCKKA